MKTGTLEPASNAATWTDTIEFYDDETGDPLFTEATVATHPDEITLKVRRAHSDTEELSGSLTGGELVIVGDGIVEFTFSATAMAALDARTYEVGVLYTQEDVTTQIILGTLPVLKGL
jgi:hypothetical protein